MTTPPAPERLDQLASVLENCQPPVGDSVLVGWVIITEWATPNGRALGYLSGSGPGTDHNVTSWQARGYLHEILSASWPWDDADDEVDA